MKRSSELQLLSAISNCSSTDLTYSSSCLDLSNSRDAVDQHPSSSRSSPYLAFRTLLCPLSHLLLTMSRLHFWSLTLCLGLLKNPSLELAIPSSYHTITIKLLEKDVYIHSLYFLFFSFIPQPFTT